MKKIHSLLCNSINIIFILISFAILLSRLFISIRFSIFEGHINQARFYNFFNFYTILIILLLFFCISKFLKNDFSNKLSLILSFLIPFITGVIFLSVYKYVPSSDAKACLDIAKHLIDGKSFEDALLLYDNYLRMFPFQLGYITFLEPFVYLFKEHGALLFQYFQIIVYSIANVYLYKICLLYTKNKHSVNACFIIVNVVWIIPYIFAPYLYGFSLGLSFSIISLYYFVNYVRNHNAKYLFISLLLEAIAIYIKMNYAILLIAYFLFILFLEKDNKILRRITLTACILLSLVFSMKLVNISAKVFYNQELPKGMPMTAWIPVGSPDGTVVDVEFNPYATPGYYNGYNWQVAVESQYDYDKAKSIVNEDIKHIANFICQNPKKALEYYSYKFMGTWDTSDFLAITYMNGEGEFDYNNPLVKSSEEGFVRVFIEQITNVGVILICLSSLIYIYIYIF